MRMLIRREWERERQRQHLIDLLHEGSTSAPAGTADAAYFNALRGHIRARRRDANPGRLDR